MLQTARFERRRTNLTGHFFIVAHRLAVRTAPTHFTVGLRGFTVFATPVTSCGPAAKTRLLSRGNHGFWAFEVSAVT